MGSSVGAGADEGGSFGIQPGPGGSGVGHRRAGRGRWGNAGPSVLFGGNERVHRYCGGTQVMIEKAGQRSPSIPLAVLDGAEVGGVGPQQIMHAIPAGVGGLDQVCPGQEIEEVLGLVSAGVGEGGGSIWVQARAGM